MHPDRDPDEVQDAAGTAGEWLGVAEAARRLGVSEKAVRNRINRGTIPWRAAGNRGREVLLAPGVEPDEDDALELRVRLARLEERLALTERERDMYRTMAGDREAELREMRRPVLLRVIEMLRRR